MNWEGPLTQGWWYCVCFQKHSTVPQPCFGCTKPDLSQLQDATPSQLLLHRKKIAVVKYFNLQKKWILYHCFSWNSHLQACRKDIFFNFFFIFSTTQRSKLAIYPQAQSCSRHNGEARKFCFLFGSGLISTFGYKSSSVCNKQIGKIPFCNHNGCCKGNCACPDP